MSAFARKKTTRGITGISFDAKGVSAVGVERHAGRRPVVALCDYRPFDDMNSAGAAVGGLARDHHLKRAYCSTVLGGSDYKLVMTETPEVAADELIPALRWKIKDLIDIPVTDITIDIFDAPSTNVAGRARQVYVVAARNEALKQRVEMLTGAAINLQVIDIPESAQRNIAALLEQDQSGVALLSLSAQGGLLTLTRQGELYLARNLSVGLEGLRNTLLRESVLAQIVLEIQRSLDFIESHFRQAPIRHVVLGPLPVDIDGLTDYLQTNLGVQVSLMDLDQLFEWRAVVNKDLQAQCFTALGAALRQEGAST